ncbi:MAG TPA: hypothetical protein VI306_24170 [Pyrinomonadaceae bacterium]
MIPHRITLHTFLLCLILFSLNNTFAQNRKAPPGGRLGVVVDERLSALRETPDLRGRLVRRLGRGRLVAIRSVKAGRDGIVFYLVNVTSRTHGWIQREAIISTSRTGDDERLYRLIDRSAEFDCVSRARIFLDHFPRSRWRPLVLLRLADAAEQVSEKLSRDAVRRLTDTEEASLASLFLNYSGLDRYNRQGVGFVFDETNKRLHYDGAAWRELVRRYQKTNEAVEARKRLAALRQLH